MSERVCGYCRVSTALDSQKESADNQIELATERIKNTPGWEFAGIYSDPEFSGTNEGRLGFQRMMSDARRHKFDRILCKSISRFARNTVLTIETLKELQELGIAIEFEKEQIDTGGPYSEMLLTILSAFAQEESRNISERVKKGLRMRVENGEARWSRIYGYTKDDEEKYIIVEEEAAVIRGIFDEYEKGMQPTENARRLNQDGVPSPAGLGWKIVNVKYILTNHKYAGNILTNARITENHMTHKQVKNTGQVERIPIKDHHKAIVPQEQFDRVQKIVEMKRTGQYPFMGLMTCPICGRTMRKVRPSGNDYYWACEDDRFYISVDKVEDAVIRAFEVKGKEPSLGMEFWQFDGMIDEITFGSHYGLKDRTVTVIWRGGTETTVESNVRNIWRIKAFLEKKEQMAQPVRGERTVTVVET